MGGSDRDLPIAIVGGGFAGTYCAHLLAQGGKDVVLFDMGRNVGGSVGNRTLQSFCSLCKFCV